MCLDEKLNLLLHFYPEDKSGAPGIYEISPEKIPEPYYSLLVHTGDMTPVLENYHQETIHLKVLNKRVTNSVYFRKVLLLLNSTNEPAEFGAIRIYLERFSPEAQKIILAGNRPLGTILHDQKIRHSSNPTAYFRLMSTPEMLELLKLPEPIILYGRCNVIRNGGGISLADIMEILPYVHS